MKRTLLSASLLLILAGLCGCPYESRAPLAESGVPPLDSRLLGTWSALDRESGDVSSLTVLAFNASEYLIQTAEDDGSWSLYRGVPFTIAETQFVQINEVEPDAGPHGYIFARYHALSDETIEVRFVGERLLSDSLSADPGAIAATIAAHLKDPMLDDEESVLELRRPGGSPGPK